MPFVAALLILGALPGCRMWGTTRYTDPVTETRTIDSAGLTALEIKTHNGGIQYTVADPAAAQTEIKLTRKGGARTREEAEKALAAIEVFVEPADGGLYKVGYRWMGIRSPSWQAVVDVTISGPASVSLDAETHNGGITVRGVQGNVKLVTHNGGVNAHSGGGALSIDTHNGGIDASHAGSTIQARTHNGGVKIDLREAAAISGGIVTHNGGITLTVSDKTSAALSGHTENGSIKIDVPLASATMAKTSVTGTLGAGGGPLTLETHNGGIRVRSSLD